MNALSAEIYLKQDNITDAIKEYIKLTSINPNNIDYVINFANIYIKKHDYLNSRKVLKNFVKNNPEQKTNTRLKPYKILLF